MPGSFAVQQNAGNQETRQHKKQVYAHPSVGENAPQVYRRILFADVHEHDQQDGDTADAIELWNPVLHFWLQIRNNGQLVAP
jgi:hypothetical protein